MKWLADLHMNHFINIIIFVFRQFYHNKITNQHKKYKYTDGGYLIQQNSECGIVNQYPTFVYYNVFRYLFYDINNNKNVRNIIKIMICKEV